MRTKDGRDARPGFCCAAEARYEAGLNDQLAMVSGSGSDRHRALCQSCGFGDAGRNGLGLCVFWGLVIKGDARKSLKALLRPLEEQLEE